MAEFGEVMRAWHRTCDDSKCGDCNITVYHTGYPCYHKSIGEWREDEWQQVEKIVMQWAAEHPEPVYPTWGTWLATEFGYDLREIMYEPIPADIAQKLGIEPKENV